MSELREHLKEEMLAPEYRYAYAEDYMNSVVAAQIKALREQRKMTQEDLAKEIGTKQSGIARLENINYSAWKTETLRRLARAFGIRLKITFEEFGPLLEEVEAFSREALERRSFKEDPEFHEPQERVVVPRRAVGGSSSIGTSWQEGWAVSDRLQEETGETYSLTETSLDTSSTS